MRLQYHFRKSPRGLLARDVRKLVARTSSLQPVEIPLPDIAELNQSFWFDLEGHPPTCRRIAEHARMIEAAELKYPIIVDPDGRVMDGMHRVCKALNLGLKFIQAYRLQELPEPDFIGVAPDDLPYDAGPLHQNAPPKNEVPAALPDCGHPAQAHLTPEPVSASSRDASGQ